MERTGIERTEPDGVDAELLEVWDLAGDPFEVADAVPVGVAEGSGVDLVNTRLAPPTGVSYAGARIWTRGRKESTERAVRGKVDGRKRSRRHGQAGQPLNEDERNTRWRTMRTHG